MEGIPQVERVVRDYADKNPQKLRQIGMNHDMAQAKGINPEEMEKKIAETEVKVEDVPPSLTADAKSQPDVEKTEESGTEKEKGTPQDLDSDSETEKEVQDDKSLKPTAPSATVKVSEPRSEISNKSEGTEPAHYPHKGGFGKHWMTPLLSCTDMPRHRSICSVWAGRSRKW
jgi:hypothetical protein